MTEKNEKVLVRRKATEIVDMIREHCIAIASGAFLDEKTNNEGERAPYVG